MSKNYNVITLGCRLNFWESNEINSYIDNNKKNDLIVFNTCSVTNEAIKNTRKYIKTFHKLNPKVKIALTGCGIETDHKFFKDMEEVSFIIKNNDKLSKEKWIDVQRNIKSESKVPFKFKKVEKENPSNSLVRKFIKIQNGCNHSCTFCIIPKCRGSSVSENVDKVNEEIAINLDKGIKEIILTGVDITSWQNYQSKYSMLGDLIENILKKNKGNFRLRLSSIDAAELDEKIFYLIENDPRLMPHFHFSLQSLNDLILKRMKRRHNVGQIINLFEKIRSIRSSVTFGADFICGFPTETEKMFLETLKLAKELRISHLHVFPYSEKKGTPAARMPQVELHKRRNRAKILRQLGKDNYLEILRNEINKKHKVLIETEEGVGKTENNLKVKVTNANKGNILDVKLDKIFKDYLIVE